jgi:hypothetical protein
MVTYLPRLRFEFGFALLGQSYPPTTEAQVDGYEPQTSSKDYSRSGRPQYSTRRVTHDTVRSRTRSRS